MTQHAQILSSTVTALIYIPIELVMYWVKSDRESEKSYDIPYLWNLKSNDTNELTKQKEIHRLGEQT